MALSFSLKKDINQWYKSLQQQIPDFVSRPQQREMIAWVAKTFAADVPRHLVIEAPTGVGKTLSYLLPGIAVSRAEARLLVVSTANVALQDQIFSKDLPLLKKIIPDLKFTAAFGRGRYICPRNLSMMSDQQAQGDLGLFLNDQLAPSSDAEQKICLTLEKSLAAFQWDGVRDHYQNSIDDQLWAKVSTDKANCLARNCYYFRECPYFIARKEIDNADVVVTNHALVMAALESDSVLPSAKDLLLVLDEGHHLPDVARDALEVEADITANWNQQQLDHFVQQLTQCLAWFPLKNPPSLAKPERLQQHCQQMRELLLETEQHMAQLLPVNTPQAEYRFVMGLLPEPLMALCSQLSKLSESLRGLAEYMVNDLSEKTGKQDVVRLHRSLLAMSRMQGYWENFAKLWRLAAQVKSSNAPISKWVSRYQQEKQLHYRMHCVGLRVSDQLEKLLWNKVPHVVVTSATLRSLNSFARIQELSGLDEQAGDQFVCLDSPFDHVTQGRLVIPQMRYEPLLANESEHLQEMAQFFRHELASGKHKGMLVLFASQRALSQFVDLLPDLRLMLLVQGDQPRYRLVELHCQRVQQGNVSVLIGLQSFAEGLDLKGELLTQVHIHKIAFPPIDNPVVVTEGEWLKSLKRYPFEVQSLPSASFNLIQQVGRLIRSHHCCGEIVIYDRRLLTKGYGARLLAALPVFPIEQRAMPDNG